MQSRAVVVVPSQNRKGADVETFEVAALAVKPSDRNAPPSDTDRANADKVHPATVHRYAVEHGWRRVEHRHHSAIVEYVRPFAEKVHRFMPVGARQRGPDWFQRVLEAAEAASGIENRPVSAVIADMAAMVRPEDIGSGEPEPEIPQSVLDERKYGRCGYCGKIRYSQYSCACGD
jgi:hypothetical protein